MNEELFKQLKAWRIRQAEKEGREVYKIVSNAALESIATFLPRGKKELLGIKGIAERNFQKYGMEILSMVNGFEKEEGEEVIQLDTEEKIYSVSDYLNLVNVKLNEVRAGVKGEISSYDIRDNFLFFDLKDPQDESVVSCFMWRSDYDVYGVEIEEGMEVTVHGYPEVYKPSGRFSIRARSIELVGEGVLKKAYEELKRKLEQEGVFDPARKKTLPALPRKIGLITSKEGAVIHDFMSNIGNHGFKISFFNSRVEGQLAVKELIEAVKHFKDENIDVLVIIRGGGSFESLQPFNNESLVRAIAELSFPVICGIGHDKDVPLLSMAADVSVSTPTAVTRILNDPWEKMMLDLEHFEKEIIRSFAEYLQERKYLLDESSNKMKGFYQKIIERFRKYEQGMQQSLNILSSSIKQQKYFLNTSIKSITGQYDNMLSSIISKLESYTNIISNNNPEKQLKLGYSIASVKGKVIRKVSQVAKGDEIDVKVYDGRINSVVKRIKNN